MEQLVILLLILLISLVNWLIKKSTALREARKLERRAAMSGETLKGEPPPQPETDTEKSMRRFREALGLPDDVEPPALPRRVKHFPLPEPPPQPPPLPPAAKPAVFHLPAVRAHAEHRIFELPTRIGKPARSKVEVAEAPSRIRELLGSTGGLRDAVVLSEILGPPKCLRATQGELIA